MSRCVLEIIVTTYIPVSNKQRINRCKNHCTCHLVYMYTPSTQRQMEGGGSWHLILMAVQNHPPPSEWNRRYHPRSFQTCITNVLSCDTHLTPKEVQKGVGKGYRPIEKSLAAANLDRIITEGLCLIKQRNKLTSLIMIK